MISVVGGVYQEVCREPHRSSECFGSGGRAACALGSLTKGNVRLVSYADKYSQEMIDDLAAIYKFRRNLNPRSQVIEFDYFHVLSKPYVSPFPINIEKKDKISVCDDVVLRFGMLECDIESEAKVTVYDPQSETLSADILKKSIRSEKTAFVLNTQEAKSIGASTNLDDAIAKIFSKFGPDVIAVKQGPLGVYVHTRDQWGKVPAYKSKRVWKIGSGDIFSAAFTYFWGVERCDPVDAANLASMATAFYCTHRNPGIPGKAELKLLDFPPLPTDTDIGAKQVYLAGPFFDMSQRWMISQARDALSDMGIKVFSPVHDVGMANNKPPREIYRKDIDGLEASNIIFAVVDGLDSGTLFELGYAANKGIPIVMLAQRASDADLLMPIGANSFVYDDFATAIYSTVWECL